MSHSSALIVTEPFAEEAVFQVPVATPPETVAVSRPVGRTKVTAVFCVLNCKFTVPMTFCPTVGATQLPLSTAAWALGAAMVAAAPRVRSRAGTAATRPARAVVSTGQQSVSRNGCAVFPNRLRSY